MAKGTILSVESDFAGVLSFLKSRGIIPDLPPSRMVGFSRRLHRATYGLILWKFRLTRIPEHGSVFVEEIASDALQIMPQALMGYGKTTRLLVRGIIENVFRHIYFLDHPIEFRRMNREQKWYMSMEDLFAYPGIHEELLALEARFDAVNKLKTLYRELSAGIHGRRVQDLEMRASLQKIVFREADFEKHVADVEDCAGPTNFLLAAMHPSQFHAFPPEDRKCILVSMPARARQILRGLQ
jgi:hypothetical protein